MPVNSNQSTHHWLGRFAVELMKLRHDISIRYAVGRAVQVYGHSSDLAPEIAAQIDAKVLACGERPGAFLPTVEALQ